MAKIDKLLELAKGHLDQGEQVLATVQGTYETKIMGTETTRAGILMATQARVVFFAKKLGGYDLESFPYGNVSSFEQSKSMMGHSVSFFASGNKVSMKWIVDAAAMQTLVTTVKGHLHGALPSNIPGTNVGQPVAVHALALPVAAVGGASQDEIMATLRQLGELHQAGVLSDEEFSTKKAELLARL